MSRARWVYVGLMCLVAIAMAAANACSASSDRGFGDDDDDDDGVGNTGAGANQGGMFLPGGYGGGGQELGCSPDLQHVIDGQGNIIKTCQPDEGCSGGECVPACQAAADSQGNVGCDFTVATPYFYVGIAPPCFAVFLANNWPKDAHITITRGGASYDVTQFGRMPTTDPNAATWPAVPATGLPPGQVAVMFLSHDPSSENGGNYLTCPVPPAINMSGGSAVAGTGKGQAWHIQTDSPVSAYDILPYGGALSYLPSAELIVPSTAWGDNYIAVLPKDSDGPPWGQIVAAQDGTQIDIVPSVALPGGANVPAAPTGNLTSFQLQAGEYVQWQLSEDMTGSIIQSNHPIAFVGGNAYICYSSATSSGGGCDSAHQMIPPIRAQGHEYVAPPYRSRGSMPESIPYRVVGAVNGTLLWYDPPILGAPAQLEAGQRADFETDLAFVVSSQDADHPFYVGQIMTGCSVPGNDDDGDEEFVNILPPAQFLSKYVYFTDPTYPTTNLVLTRMVTPTGFHEVDIDCLGNVGGWTDVGVSGTYQITNVDLIRDSVGNGSCTNGPHVAESDGPFGLMVWGLSWFSSYAYPAGGSAAPINTVVVPPVPK